MTLLFLLGEQEEGGNTAYFPCTHNRLDPELWTLLLTKELPSYQISVGKILSEEGYAQEDLNAQC